jgi:hypothetical protein
MIFVGLVGVGVLAGLVLGTACLTWYDLRRLDAAVDQLRRVMSGGEADD